MKNNKLMKNTVLFLGMCLCLSSCGVNRSYKDNLDSYKVELNYHNNYRIVQIADLHWSVQTDLPNAKKYFLGLVEEIKSHYGNIDLFEFTGDQFMLANELTLTKFFEMMREINIPYAMTFGNHDRECTYSQDWLTKELKKEPLCIYKEVEDDDLYGRSNFVINLKQDDQVKWQLYNLDSGANLLDKPFDIKLTYDYLRDDQLDFVNRIHIPSVPGISYYHIPQKAFEYAFENKDNLGLYNNYFKLEGFGDTKAIDDMKAFETFKNNDVKGVFVGHAHANDWTVDYEGVTLGFGVKTGKELYYGKVSKELAKEVIGIDTGFDLYGASVVTLKDDATFDLEHLYYNQKDDGNFIHWEKYHA